MSHWPTFNTQSYGYDESKGHAFYVALRQRLEGAPGVQAVTYADRIPLTMSNSGASVSIEGGGADGQQRMRMRVELGLVDSDYFDTLGIRLFAGREFTPADGPASAAVADRQREVRAAGVAGHQPCRGQLAEPTCPEPRP